MDASTYQVTVGKSFAIRLINDIVHGLSLFQLTYYLITYLIIFSLC